MVLNHSLASGSSMQISSVEYAEEEARVQVQEMPKDGEVHRVNLSSVWTRSTDALLLPALDEDEKSRLKREESVAATGRDINKPPERGLSAAGGI